MAKKKITKTIFIWQESFYDVVYLILEGNYEHLNDVYINAGDEKKEDELSTLMYNEEGYLKHETLKKFPVDKVDTETAVIACGFYP